MQRDGTISHRDHDVPGMSAARSGPDLRYALGLMCHGWHESAAALLADGVVVAAAEEERFTRRKLDGGFPANAIRYCLDQAGIGPDDLEVVGFGYDTRRRRAAKAAHLLRYFPASLELVRTRGAMVKRLGGVERELRGSLGYRGPFLRLDHHACHAASAYYSSPFASAAVLTMDGVGDWESCWWGVGQGDGLTRLGKIDWPRSLGHVYAALTEFLGFRAFHDEYKVMGLAAYGKSDLLPAVEKVFWPTAAGFDVDLGYFNFHLGRTPRFGQRFVEAFGPPLADPETDAPAHHRDVAASFQRQLEVIVVHLARKVLAATGETRLCLAGGVALNAVANGRIIREAGVDALFVPPCSSDAGCALGAAHLAARARGDHVPRSVLTTGLLGPAYDDERIERAIRAGGLVPRRIADPPVEAARMLAGGKVLAWFEGRMEFGQRALGARSILADPRDARMRELINAKVKFREPFRPFAPSVLEERAAEFFVCGSPTPFMTEVYPVREEKKADIPAVVHVDGTARVQTVSREAQPVYWRLIKAFDDLTGIPVVLNTSFNVRGEPIVNSPEDAVATFRNSAIDVLIAGHLMVERATT
jgi:carbamoyltransferase